MLASFFCNKYFCKKILKSRTHLFAYIYKDVINLDLRKIKYRVQHSNVIIFNIRYRLIKTSYTDLHTFVFDMSVVTVKKWIAEDCKLFFVPEVRVCRSSYQKISSVKMGIITVSNLVD